MANRYMVRVYDCSFVQDYVIGYDKYFDTLDGAKDYAFDLMYKFGQDARFEYTCEVLIRTITIGCYEPIGYYEFDCMGTDMDMFELLADLDAYNELSNFSYHDVF